MTTESIKDKAQFDTETDILTVEATTSQLQQGDVVQLKSGGPKMTVSGSGGSDTDCVTCAWFNDRANAGGYADPVHVQRFPMATLVKVDSKANTLASVVAAMPSAQHPKKVMGCNNHRMPIKINGSLLTCCFGVGITTDSKNPDIYEVTLNCTFDGNLRSLISCAQPFTLSYTDDGEAVALHMKDVVMITSFEDGDATRTISGIGTRIKPAKRVEESDLRRTQIKLPSNDTADAVAVLEQLGQGKPGVVGAAALPTS